MRRNRAEGGSASVNNNNAEHKGKFMRIAAGVMLIIAAVLNLFASIGYLGFGGAMTGVGSMDEMGADGATLVAGGGMLMAMGLFLLVSVGILIAGAVFLFQQKKPGFALGAGVMAILAEVFGILITAFGIMNIIGLVAGVLAIIAAKSYTEGGSEPEAA